MPTPLVNDAEIREGHECVKKKKELVLCLFTRKIIVLWGNLQLEFYEKFQCCAVICMKCVTGGSWGFNSECNCNH